MSLLNLLYNVYEQALLIDLPSIVVTINLSTPSPSLSVSVLLSLCTVYICHHHILLPLSPSFCLIIDGSILSTVVLYICSPLYKYVYLYYLSIKHNLHLSVTWESVCVSSHPCLSA